VKAVAYWLNYGWRVVATGYNFAFFGLGGLFLTLTLLPLVRLWPGTPARKNERARGVIHLVFRYFVWQMQATGCIRVRLIDPDRLRASDGHLIIANHPTLIDVVLLLALLPKSNCVVKDALFRNPMLQGVVRATGYIRNSADPEQLLQQCRETLAAGHSIVVFPEGTRTRPGQPLRFQRGAAHIAVRCGADIVPVSIRCAPPMLRKGERWYQIPSRRAQIDVQAFAPIRVAAVTGAQTAAPLATRRLNRHLENYYCRLGVAGGPGLAEIDAGPGAAPDPAHTESGTCVPDSPAGPPWPAGSAV
jgi:1-acyl-sn-glycerol-3-phosphate acyltransferase